MQNISLDKPSKSKYIPFYFQIANHLRRKIEQGELEPGTKLPRELELAKIFGVSRVTLRQALSLLETDGLLRRERRKGTFINSQIEKPKTINLQGVIWEEDSSQEKRRVISVKDIPCTPSIAEFFNLPLNENVTRIERLRMTGGKPFCHVMNYLSSNLSKKVSRHDIQEKSMIKILKNSLQISLGKIHQTFEARTADSELALHLGIEVLDPVLYVETFIYSDEGVPLEYSQIYYRGNQHKYRIELSSNGDIASIY